MTVIPIVIVSLGTGTEIKGNKNTSGDHLTDNTLKADQNTEKTTEKLKRGPRVV